MARFYAQYQNSDVTALHAIDVANCYNRVGMNTTNAGTARTSMLNTRATLSSSFYSSINVGNRNGTLGIVVPANAYTNNGTTFSGANLYTNTAAIWPSDPRVRPTAQIVIANSTAGSPTDNFSAPTSEYNAARTAVQDYFAAVTGSPGSPYARIGLDPWRTLASIWHNHDLTYMAWDDFTPGQMQSYTVSLISGVGEPEQLRFSGTFQYRNDYNPDARVELIASLVGPSTYNLNTLVTPTGSTFQFDWLPNNPNSVTPGSYTLSSTVRVRDPVITTHFGNVASYPNSYNFPI